MAVLVPAPQDAIAVAHCLLARNFPTDPLTHPPEGCRFCPKPTSDLIEALRYFDITAEWDGQRTDWRAEHIRSFRALPEREQKRLVREAQAIREAVPA